MLRVAHVTPTFFHPTSVVGGGDRYPMEVAAAQRRLGIDARVYTYGPADAELEYNGAPVHVRRIRHAVGGNLSNPLGAPPWQASRECDVIHAYQEHTVSTNAAVGLARAMGKRAFVTDLGATTLSPSRYVDLGWMVSGYLPISEYAARPHARWASKTWNIGAGVDLARFTSASRGEGGYVLYVGRILPHKGIDYLVEAMPDDLELVIAGEPYHAEYLVLLRDLAKGKRVTFRHSVSDAELRELYAGALCTVLPTVTTDRYGSTNPRAQLSALTVLESFASRRPVVATAVEAVPEIVEDGVTGFLVPPNEPAALGSRIDRLRGDPAIARRMGEAGRARVERDFTWDAVARRALAAYEAARR